VNRRYSTTMFRPVLFAGRLADRDPRSPCLESLQTLGPVQISEMNYDSM